MARPLLAHIDGPALRANVELASKKVAHGKVMAVVKANAYGHGIKGVISAFDQADALAVSSIDEALLLRDVTDKPIVLLEGLFCRSEVALSQHMNCVPVLHSREQVEWMLDARPEGSAVWIKLDTGLNRLGFDGMQAEDEIARLERGGIQVEGIMSHLANAESPSDPFTYEQYRRFQRLSVAGRNISISNSAGILRGMSLSNEYIRPGIMLYGASPLADISAADFGLQPVMSLTSELIAVRECRVGERIGYGNETVCTRPTRVGVIACGYGDGYPRHASLGTPVLVDGQLAGLIGRVCMDMLFVDISAIPAARLGSKVILWGRGLSVETVASCASTIANDLLSGITARVPRHVKKH